uniref:Uncharacterized protein n=1 Tax=Strongyloides venezuelensis TaxID=75913 RepID=A0A0K0F705_STRVS
MDNLEPSCNTKSDDEEIIDPEAPELKEACMKLLENSYEFEKSATKLKPFKTGNGFLLMSTSRKKFRLWLPQPIKQKKPNLLKMRRKDLQLIEDDKKILKKQINSSLLSENDFNNLLKNK